MIDSETVSFPLIKLNAMIRAIYDLTIEPKWLENESGLALIIIELND